jgi:DHA2 family lincomycin resistance protein-like MFS transporter
LGSLGQVAGAAGVALFIAVMSAQSTGLADAGATPLQAMAGGIRAAFFCGALIAIFAVICSFFVRRPQIASAGVAH